MRIPRTLTGEDIALAMELRASGVEYQHIATGLGVHVKTLRQNLRHAEQAGYRETPAPVCSRIRVAYVNYRAAVVLANRTQKVPGNGAGVCGGVA